MDVWVVEYTRISTGNRIEGFDVEFTLFTNKTTALNHAWKLATYYIDSDIPFSENGNYKTDNNNYEDWPKHKIEVTKKQFIYGDKACLELSTYA